MILINITYEHDPSVLGFKAYALKNETTQIEIDFAQRVKEAVLELARKENPETIEFGSTRENDLPKNFIKD